MTLPRRQLLRGSLGALFAAGLAGAGRALAGPGGHAITPAKRCVVLFLHGGASQIDTFDPKPGRPTGGEFRAIESAVSGLRLSEHLPGLAARMHRLSLIRSLSAKEGNHERARYLMHTGFAPQGGVEHPGLGSHHVRSLAARGGFHHGLLAARRPTAPSDLPRQVSLNLPGQGPGYLGARWSAFTVPDAGAEVRNLAPPNDLPRERIERRVELWRALDDGFAAQHHAPQVEGARAIGEQAVAMSAAPEIAAFELAQESDQTRARYGLDRDQGSFAAGCLMARRLLEAGVDFVEVGLRGWDTHEDNFTRVRELSAVLDRGASALIDDLIAGGLWSETLLLCIGDFGRTPRINGRGGRDHFPQISSVLLGGGPIRAGAVVGETDEDGEEIRERPVTVADLFATLTTALGIAGDEVHVAPSGRPVTTVDEAGAVIGELV